MLCAAAAPAAGAPTDALAPGERGIVLSAIDGDTLALANGLAVRLAGVQAPKRGTDAALAEEARAALAALVGGRTVTLRYGGARRDRYRRAVAHAVRDDGLWVQDAMLRAGLARVHTLADNHALATEMYAAERAARAARRGIWSHPRYRVRAPDDLDDAIGSFRIVEGRTVAAARARDGRIYLNFGEHWRSDFTVAIARRNRTLFESAWAEAGLAPVSALAGRRIRVRGWLRAENGPLIEADHPEQIELLDAPGGERDRGGSGALAGALTPPRRGPILRFRLQGQRRRERAMPNGTRNNDRGGGGWGLVTSNAANMLTTLLIGGALFATVFYIYGELREEMRLLRAEMADNRREAADNLRRTEERLTALIQSVATEAAENLRDARSEGAANLREARAEEAANLRQVEVRLTAEIKGVATEAAANLRQAEERLTAEIKGVATEAAENLRQAEGRLTVRIDDVATKADENLRQAEERLTAEIKGVAGEAAENLRQAEERLTAEIKGVAGEAAENLRQAEERLTARIDGVAGEAAENLRQAEGRLTVRIDGVATEAAENLRQAEGRLTVRIDGVATEAAENLRQAEERLTVLIQGVATRAAEDLREARAEGAADLRDSERRTAGQIAALVTRFDGYALQSEQFRDGLKDDLHRIAIGMKVAEEERAAAKEHAEALEREIAELSFATDRGPPPFGGPRQRVGDDGAELYLPADPAERATLEAGGWTPADPEDPEGWLAPPAAAP